MDIPDKHDPFNPVYVVKAEHTLGYICGWHSMGWLAALIRRGGNPDPLQGTIAFSPDEIRPATPEDFDAFRVMRPPSMRGE